MAISPGCDQPSGSAQPGELTAELRFWWQRAAPPEVVTWFEAGRAGAQERRTDVYCITGSLAMGIKRRGGAGEAAQTGIECKSLVALAKVDDRLCAPVEIWLKCRASGIGLPAGPTLAVAKTRRLRRFAVCEGAVSEIAPDRADNDCMVELGTVQPAGQAPWSTLCIEARAEPDDPVRKLAAVWRFLEPPPCLLEARSAGYPAWLASLP